MSRIRDIILEVLAESTKKVEFVLSNPKLVAGLTQAIQNDIEIEDKSLTPQSLLSDWDTDAYLDKSLVWVVHQYINGAFHYGDIDKVKADLAKFEKYKNKKSFIVDGTLKSSDINSYNYSDLKQDLDKIDDNNIQNLGSSARKNAVEHGKDEADKVYEDEDWVVMVPKTQAAAMYWGKDTKWCTAADSEKNMFNTYNKKGPLFIAINKNDPKEKYQACFEVGEYKDINDNNGRVPKDTKVFEFLKNEAINRNAIKSYWYWLKENEITDEMMLNALKNVKIQYGNIDWDSNQVCFAIDQIFYKKDKPMSEDFIKEAVSINPKFIKEIKNPSPEVQIIYLNWVWNNIKNRSSGRFDEDDMFVVNNYINNELSDEAKIFIKDVETEEQERRRQNQIDEYMEYAKSGRLDRIPEEERTYGMYLTAVKAERPYHKVSLNEIPNAFKDSRMYQTYAENNLRYGILQEIPKQYLTKKLCLDAVKANRYNLMDVPDKLKTLEICKAAGDRNGYYEERLWDVIPDSFKLYLQ